MSSIIHVDKKINCCLLKKLHCLLMFFINGLRQKSFYGVEAIQRSESFYGDSKTFERRFSNLEFKFFCFVANRKLDFKCLNNSFWANQS